MANQDPGYNSEREPSKDHLSKVRKYMIAGMIISLGILSGNKPTGNHLF